jgi:hypothetical protein
MIYGLWLGLEDRYRLWSAVEVGVVKCILVCSWGRRIEIHYSLQLGLGFQNEKCSVVGVGGLQ